MIRPWTCAVCDTSNGRADVVCRLCGARATSIVWSR